MGTLIVLWLTLSSPKGKIKAFSLLIFHGIIFFNLLLIVVMVKVLEIAIIDCKNINEAFSLHL